MKKWIMRAALLVIVSFAACLMVKVYNIANAIRYIGSCYWYEEQDAMVLISGYSQDKLGLSGKYTTAWFIGTPTPLLLYIPQESWEKHMVPTFKSISCL